MLLVDLDVFCSNKSDEDINKSKLNVMFCIQIIDKMNRC